MRNGAGIYDSPGRAHPGTERRAMRSLLMMGIMVRLVRDGLRRGEAPDQQDRQDQETSEGSCDHTVHRISLCNRTGGRMVLEAGGRVKTVGARIALPNLPGRIRKKFAVYCADYFVR